MPGRDEKFTLEVPLDASQIGDAAEAQKLRVVARAQDGSLTSKTVQTKPGERTSVALSFAESPGPLQLLVGPASASESELVNFQTISLDVPSHLWGERPKLSLEPILIAPYYWWWWLEWCREIVIRGKVVCADGSPVPGATVCAYDVDWWFWWTNTELAGCATTDINGAFEINFRWCCGRWPWWWWENRVWEIDPDLLARIGAVLERDPGLTLGRTSNQPSLGVFSEILASTGAATGGTLQPSDVGRLEQIRGAVLAKLPAAPELEALRVWPWSPWWPWLDCSPNIIFRATQDCVEKGGVIIDEGFAQTRWNIADSLEVVLTANELACCVQSPCPDRPCPEGECIVVSDICGTPIDEVSGNLGAPTAPMLGLLAPGAAPGSSPWAGDRPFAGTADVHYANTMTGVDYYEIEYYSTTGLPTTWSPLPLVATPAIQRQYIDTSPLSFGNVAFPFKSISGHNVVESREYYEATSGWDPLKQFWMTNKYLLVEIDSMKLPGGDGTYWFRVVGWQVNAGGELVNRRVLPLCDTKTDNGWVLTFDNRVETTAPYPDGCGTGYVTQCVDQPVTGFIDVLVNGTKVEPCAVVAPTEGMLPSEEMFEVEFLVEDPSGWLGGYTLAVTWGSSGIKYLVPYTTSPPTPLPAGWSLTAITADCAGPEYGQALSEGCVAPDWKGGRMLLRAPLEEVFVGGPCCYQLQLSAWTRHVVDCEGEAAYTNLSEYTIGWGVCPPQAAPVGTLGAVDAER